MPTHAPVVVYTAQSGPHGAWLSVSPQVESIFGYTAEELLHDPDLWASRLHPDDLERVLAEEAEHTSQPYGRFVSEYRLMAKDGRVVWVLDETTLLDDPELGPLQHGLLFDITDRKLAELRIVEHADLLERIARAEPLEAVLQALAEALVRVCGADAVSVGLHEPPRTFLAGSRLASADKPLHVLTYGPDPDRYGDLTVVGPAVLSPDTGAWAQRLAALAVTQSRQAADQARAYSLQLATVESTVDGILVVDNDGAVVSTNQRFRDLIRVGDSTAETGTAYDVAMDVLDRLHEPTAFKSRLKDLLTHPDRSSVDELHFHDGRIVEAFSQPQMLEGRPVGRVWSFRDVTSLRRLEHDLRHQAHTDALTSLPNRHRFMQRLAELVPADEEAVAPGYALLLIDVDDFKTINDGLGHFAGDAMLVAVAERVAQCLEEVGRRGGTAADPGMAARLGGDEFALWLPCPEGRSEAGDLVEALVATLEPPVDAGSRQLTIRVSIGVTLSDGVATPRDLIRNADLAMYTAKRAGGDTTRVYTPDMHDAAIARLNLKEDLGQAIDAGELSVAYQPVVSLETGHIDGFEALARWEHHNLGPISPAEFIPLAEESGLIGKLGAWVLTRVCADIAAWRAEIGAEEVPIVSVNLSPRQLAEVDLAEQITAVLDRFGLPPQAICLEVTETALGQSGVDVSETLLDIHARGLHLSLDDFGTGHSSLARLGSYPFDVVKIDRSFVVPLTEDGRHRAVVQAILQLADAFELDVIAEGVETDAQREVLEELGCARVQGFLFSRAVPAEEVRDLLSRHASYGRFAVKG
ncbi:bifunctional diguanylate cyclase/phosphodiesterase [Nocardioides mangrovicus]|uniref:bifunctional diguanylate cyclase/phosphodiesterase n=1 Tax=Nocardioides mangrovicus TaxID=2478913 RepID=UPI0011C3FAFC|nr:EAL domain-containing protein [Nocardioides mangrovicus]